MIFFKYLVHVNALEALSVRQDCCPKGRFALLLRQCSLENFTCCLFQYEISTLPGINIDFFPPTQRVTQESFPIIIGIDSFLVFKLAHIYCLLSTEFSTKENSVSTFLSVWFSLCLSPMNSSCSGSCRLPAGRDH